MADENAPSRPPSPPSEPPASTVKPTAAAPSRAVNFGHMPMTEEFDRAKWTLPPVIPVLIAAVVLAIVAAVVLYTNKKTITNAAIAQVRVAPQGDSVLVAVHVKFDNTAGKQLWTHEVTSELETADGKKFTDTANPRVDFDRFVRAFPQLAEADASALGNEQKIAQGPFSGVCIFAYPIDKATFDARKSLGLRIKFYDWPPLELKEAISH